MKATTAAAPAPAAAGAAALLNEQPLPSAEGQADRTESDLPDGTLRAEVAALLASATELPGADGSGDGAVGAAGAGGGASTDRAGRGRRPALLAARNPCSNYFPAAASADHAEVRISVRVDAAGHAHAREILAEHPAGQQFGRAAAACAAALHFVPALDALGMPVDGDAKLELHFDRS